MNETKIFIIESLKDGDKLTGTNLYNDLIQYNLPMTSKLYNGLIDKGDWVMTINKILDDCHENDIVFIHLEIHGKSDGSGITLHNGEFISFIDLCDDFRTINKKVGCNLYVTLAVCHGLFLITGMLSLQEMPFCGMIGSQETIYENDIEISFYEFYKCFLEFGNIYQAMNELEQANPDKPSSYKLIEPQEIFYAAWKKVIENYDKKDWQKKNAIKVAKKKHLSREQRRKFESEFKKQWKGISEKLYKEKSEMFFMLKEFPKNKDRFYIPKTIYDIPKNI